MTSHRPFDVRHLAAEAETDFVADHRARQARERSELLERRRQEVVEQRSETSTHEQRIRAWERIHQVNLPRDVDHPLLKVIATTTGLTVDDVRTEQLRRGPVRGTAKKSPLSGNATPVR